MRNRRQAQREKARPQQLSGSIVHSDRRHQARLLPRTPQMLTKGPLPWSQPASQRHTQPTGVGVGRMLNPPESRYIRKDSTLE